MRCGDWKLVAVKGGAWELYNLRQDRTESHNLAASEPEKVQEFQSLHDAWSARVGVRTSKLVKKPAP